MDVRISRISSRSIHVAVFFSGVMDLELVCVGVVDLDLVCVGGCLLAVRAFVGDVAGILGSVAVSVDFTGVLSITCSWWALKSAVMAGSC